MNKVELIVLLVHNVRIKTFGLTFKLVGSVSRCMSLLNLKTHAIGLMLKSYVSERKKNSLNTLVKEIQRLNVKLLSYRRIGKLAV